MCLGCCSSLGYYVANFLYVLERLAICSALTALVSCLIATLVIMLGLGVGLGYNYCIVDNTMGQFEKATYLDNKTRRSYDGDLRRAMKTSPNPARRVATTTKAVIPLVTHNNLEEMPVEPTMAVPLQKVGLLAFIIKLKKRNRNITLELVQS